MVYLWIFGDGGVVLNSENVCLFRVLDLGHRSPSIHCDKDTLHSIVIQVPAGVLCSNDIILFNDYYPTAIVGFECLISPD